MTATRIQRIDQFLAERKYSAGQPNRDEHGAGRDANEPMQLKPDFLEIFH